MWVVLDTTAILADPRLEGGAFRMLLASARRLHLDIALPRVVLDEACNYAREQLQDIAVRSEKLSREIEKFTAKRPEPALLVAEALAAATGYRKLLEAKLRAAGVRLLPYPRLAHKAVVARDLARRKPFKRDGTGYRDMLIWHTVLQLVERAGPAIAFVTANTKDFGDGRLHDDLAQDLNTLGCSSEHISLFRTVEDFNSAHVLPHLKKEEELLKALRDDTLPTFSIPRWIHNMLPFAITFSEVGDLFASTETAGNVVSVTKVLRLHEWHVNDTRIVAQGLIAVVISAVVVLDIHISEHENSEREREEAISFIEQLGLGKIDEAAGQPNFARLRLTLLIAEMGNHYEVVDVIFNHISTRFAVVHKGEKSWRRL